MSEYERWKVAVLSGLSLLNFVQANLSDRELAVVVDGWIHWAIANSTRKDAAADVTSMLNGYTANCIQAGGPRLEAQRRVIDVFKNLDTLLS